MIKTDPIIDAPSGRLWVEELRKRLANGTLKGSLANLNVQCVLEASPLVASLTGRDFTTMDGDEIDKWLDRCETVLLRDRPVKDDDTFPLPPPAFTTRPEDDNAESNSWSEYHAYAFGERIGPNHVDAQTRNAELPLIPGEKTRSYDATDFTGTLPPAFEVVINAAAEVVGVRPRDMTRIVENFERKLDHARPLDPRYSRGNQEKYRKRRSMQT